MNFFMLQRLRTDYTPYPGWCIPILPADCPRPNVFLAVRHLYRMDPLQVSDDLVLVENAVFLPDVSTLVISDLQLGHEEQLRELGSNIVYEQAMQMIGLLEALIDQTKAQRLVINGDLKHEFGRISPQERRDILHLLRTFKDKVEIVVVRGNHDTLTEILTKEVGVPMHDVWHAGGFYAVHGHALPDEEDRAYQEAHTVIIGHVHPAIRLDDGVRNERYKCFLIGSYGKKRLVVLPSFTTIVEGSDILKVASNSPFLQGNSSHVYVLADEIRPFGKVADLRRVLGKL